MLKHWILLAALVLPAAADEIEFFENKIRPLLAEKCYPCHSSTSTMAFADLRLDSREGALRVVAPGNPGDSLLIRMVRGEGKTLMPPTGALEQGEIADLEKWVELGAPWPRESTLTVAPVAADFDLEARRNAHWAWQPVLGTTPPDVRDTNWPLSAVDQFILAKLEPMGLIPARKADRYTLLRRLSFDLTGLPPRLEDIEAFVRDGAPGAYERVVDRLLESPHFGERWARHWMDLVRYTESHGSEGDPDLPQAWRYRDYLIRAFNQDVPYDQLIREHLAGDLLSNPRTDPGQNVNESIIATSHFRMVEHGFQPVDPWEDRVKWTDNQIDVLSKAFQGLTVSCARCHDHKFDAISQRDYYGLFGMIKGARPIQVAIDDSGYLRTNSARLAELKQRTRNELAKAWLAEASRLPERLLAGDLPVKAVEQAFCDETAPLFAWLELQDKEGAALADAWNRLAERQRVELAENEAFNRRNFQLAWDVSRTGDYAQWIRYGAGLAKTPSQPGEFWVTNEGDRVLTGIYPAGVYSHLLTAKHNGVLQSPRFRIDTDSISVRLLGGNFSFARLIVENYAVPRGGIYHQRYSPKSDQMTWVRWDTTYWKGFTAYIEFVTQDDATNFLLDTEDSKKDPKPEPRRDGRSFFGASQVVFHNNPLTPRETVAPIGYLLDGSPPANLARWFGERLAAAIEAWRDGVLTAKQRAYLDYFVRNDFLPTRLDLLPEVAPVVAEYRRLEEEVPVPRRAPGVLEEGGPDQPLLVRGDHNSQGDPVPRRYLAALGSEPCERPEQARLLLAAEVASADNPLTARVMVNRVWRRLFGQGIVRTVDNFGKLGDTPSHPELLDYLAVQFVRDGWSIKKLIRQLVTTRAYRMQSHPSSEARALDPGNRLLQHMPVRRLDAEAIRDALLTVSGRLDPTLFGPSVGVYYDYAKGKTKGDKDKGPLDGDGRRSVYQEIRRNAHNPFLEVFDQPQPASTRGSRDVTNVPAQSLTMLNSPFVIGQAEVWAKTLTREPLEGRVERMFLCALGRKPLPEERDTAKTFLAEAAAERGVALDDALVWQDLAHAMFNLKEFIYVR